MLKRQVMTHLRQQDNGTKYDVNKIEDLILRVLCNFSTFAGIPPARRLALLEQALKRYIAQNASYMSSLCVAWHFTASFSGDSSMDYDRLDDLGAIREIMLQIMAEQPREEATGSDPHEPKLNCSVVGAPGDMLEALRHAGCRITRRVEQWLGHAMVSDERVSVSIGAGQSESIQPGDRTERSRAAATSGSAKRPLSQLSGEDPVQRGARTIPTRLPLKLAPALLHYLRWRMPTMDAECLQWALIRELIHIDDAKYVYIPERGAGPRRVAKRAANGSSGAQPEPLGSGRCRSRARSDTTSVYEQVRLERIKEHRALLASLGLGRQRAPAPVRTWLARDDPATTCEQTAKPNKSANVLVPAQATDPSAATFASYLMRHDTTLGPWVWQLDPLWIRFAEQVAETCLCRCRKAPELELVFAHHSAPARHFKIVQRRNDFARYRQHVQQICTRYLVEMNSMENRQKRRFRNRHTSYNEPSLLADSEKNADECSKSSSQTASRAKASARGPALSRSSDTPVASALVYPSAAEEVYIWTENDYRQFFAAWRRFGNGVHANKKIAQAMNEWYVANWAANRGLNGRLKTRDGVSGNVVFLPTHIVYQKRLHRGWLDMHRSEDALKLEQLLPDEHKTNCGLCRRDASTVTMSRTGPLTGPFWEMFPDTPSKPVWIHRQCLLWAPEVFETCEGTMMNVRRAFRRALRLRCAHCGHTGAATGCFIRSCRRSYHAPECALTADCSLDQRQYRLLCAKHTKMYARALTRGASAFWESLS
ncbi:hypothetical protein F1559_004290 [Cyanidiococcus yangmingshanensis]|uniref:PHD-type domain-containing protein n=1 Tax=Cyanidiococcus yangmingshanensis TaxID=2690220 RepID=A0A7J7IPA5_9RHOD|nr:hypothetical protein F1559_004290 [Cyanidiococcus yangmingshanensis]